MTEPVKSPPSPAYPRRRQRAQATRARVLGVAGALFVEHGYVATKIDAIAIEADVAPETIYAAFGNKRALLAAVVGIAISGDADTGPIMAQAWVQEVRDEPDPHRRVLILAANGRAILERRHAIDDVVRSAAASDPDIAALHEAGKAQRFAGQRELVRVVIGTARLRRGLDLETAADAVYALGSPETYRLLVIDRGWTGDRFELWYGETIDRLLFEPEP
jgi:AcrR family transcriptional regulator